MRVPKIFILAGEESGDHLGAAVAQALAALCPQVDWHIVGGVCMEEVTGMSSIVPLKALAHTGLGAIMRHLPSLYGHYQRICQAIQTFQPDCLVTIDAPELTLRVARKASQMLPGIKRVHCVAPSVWAWRPGRAQRLPRYVDHLLGLLPIDGAYFAHMPYDFVGHPVVQQRRILREHARLPWPQGSGWPITWQQQGEDNKRVVALLPGSRPNEIQALLPTFLQAIALWQQRSVAFLCPVIVTPSSMHSLVHSIVHQHPAGQHYGAAVPILTGTQAEKPWLWASMDCAMAASGTVTLELAWHGVPMVVGYRLGAISGWLAKKLVRTPWVSLVNILANQQIVPELLQERCTPLLWAEHMQALTDSPASVQRQKDACAQVMKQLNAGTSFGQAAAKAIIRLL